MLLIFLLNFLVYTDVVSTFKCYSCASMLLSNKWHLTGYPNIVRTFSPACDSFQQLNNVDLDECTSACVTYILDVPRGPGVTTVVIRGCLDHLTGLQYSGNIVNGCEFGVVESPTVDGRSKLYLKHQLVTCSFEMCNTFDTTLPNSKCPEDFREKYRCKECSGFNDCNTGECHGKWCSKRSVKTSEYSQVTKGCSPVNIYNNITTCKHRLGKTDATIGMVNLVDVDSEFCVCQGSDCNSGAFRLHFSFGAIVLLSLFALSFFL